MEGHYSLVKSWTAAVPKDSGGVVSARTAIAAAWGHFTEVCKLAEFGGHAKVNRQWAHSLLKCMKFVQRKATTAISKASKANFAEQKKDAPKRCVGNCQHGQNFG